jgi:hypothetical protein
MTRQLNQLLIYVLLHITAALSLFPSVFNGFNREHAEAWKFRVDVLVTIRLRTIKIEFS